MRKICISIKRRKYAHLQISKEQENEKICCGQYLSSGQLTLPRANSNHPRSTYLLFHCKRTRFHCMLCPYHGKPECSRIFSAFVLIFPAAEKGRNAQFLKLIILSLFSSHVAPMSGADPERPKFHVKGRMCSMYIEKLR